MELCCDEFAAKAANVWGVRYGKHIIDGMIIGVMGFVAYNLVKILIFL